jgi:hypothetical protein
VFTKPGGNFNNYGPYTEAIDNTISSQVVYSGLLTSFSPFTIGHGLFSLLVLPIQLVRFDAISQQDDALLQWQLADAASLAYTLVEHSRNGLDYLPLGKVNALQSQQYQFRHQAPGSGLHYYRLKMVERDGSVIYSPVKQLRFGQNQTMIVGLNGNPVLGQQVGIRVYSAVRQSAEATLFDLSGRLLLQQKITLQPGENLPLILLPGLQQGLYKMQVKTADGLSATFSLIK